MTEQKLGQGINYNEEYMKALAVHKATDMKHDHLTLGDDGNWWNHYRKFIPKNISRPLANDTNNLIFFRGCNDNKFMETYLHGDLEEDGDQDRPIKSMLDLIFYCSGETDISKFNNEFGNESNGLAGDSKNVYVKFGDDIVYSYSATLQNLNFSMRNDKKDEAERTVEPTTMLENLGIRSGSILNVDFQYHLWDLLKAGPESEYEIYLIMNPENINDPAGKFNMNDSIFKRKNGVSTLLSRCITTENTIYQSWDSRTDSEPGPDFFSRFDVILSGIKEIKNFCGLIKSLGVELTIKSEEENFIYSAMSKANNSNAVVQAELARLYEKWNAPVRGEGNRAREDLELLMAAEAAKKGGGDDLQILSHWHVYNRKYAIVDSKNNTLSDKHIFNSKEEPIFFVSHDGPTIVRSLIEGNNVLFMYSQIISGKKYECAVSLIRNDVELTPLSKKPPYKKIKTTYSRFEYDFNNIDDTIEEINRLRNNIITSKTEEFENACDQSELKTEKDWIDGITNLLEKAIDLCILKNSLNKIGPFKSGAESNAIKYYNDNKNELHERILNLENDDDNEMLFSILKTLENKNNAINEEILKYEDNGEISKKLLKILNNSPEYLACSQWKKMRSSSRRTVAIVDDKVVYELYFEKLSKYLDQGQVDLFVDFLNNSFENLKDEAIAVNVTHLLSYSETRLIITGKNIGSVDIFKVSDVDTMADEQINYINDNRLVSMESDIINDSRGGARNIKMGGTRNKTNTTLCSTNERGLPYSPILSHLTKILSVNFHKTKKYTDANAYNEEQYNEYDEDQRSPLQDPNYRLLKIENVETDPKNKTRIYKTTNPKPRGGGLNSQSKESEDKKFEDLLIIGKILKLLPEEKRVKYTNEFMSIIKKDASEEHLKKWENFNFSNPISGLYLIFYNFELFFENLERKLKPSSYLPELISYFFAIKTRVDELISLCKTTTPDNFLDRFKEIRRVGEMFSLLFYSFPYLENGEEQIGELLKTDNASEFSRITTNLIYQYAGEIEYNKEQRETLESNKNLLLETNHWDSFIERGEKNLMNNMFHTFQEYDNSILLIFLGSVDLSRPLSTEDIKQKLNHFRDDSKISSNLTLEALLEQNKDTEDFSNFQTLCFRRFLSNLKEYNKFLFSWKLKDVLNNSDYINGIYAPPERIQRSRSRHTKKINSKSRDKSPATFRHRPSISKIVTRPSRRSQGGRKTRKMTK